MIKKTLFHFILSVTLSLATTVSVAASASDDGAVVSNTVAADTEVYKLSYIEREPGTDEYEVTMLVSGRYIRIDESGESSGYIVYDDKDRVIYSVSHYDQSVLLIKQNVFSDSDSPVTPVVEYLQLADAPKVSGEDIYNYRVYMAAVEADKGKPAKVAEMDETCLEVQLVENLLPAVRTILQNYQKVVSGQQVRMVDNEITEMQTACFYADQIYNSGMYYEKGLPVQEWHSNDRSRILIGYKKISVASDKFDIPEDYRQFSVGPDSKTLLGG